MGTDKGQGFFVSGGTLPPDSASYIERSADKVLLESLLEGRFCYVLNSRQFGKSSLSVHAMGRLEAKGVRTAFLDLTRIGGQNVTPEQWYSGLALALGKQLECRREVLEYWKANEAVTPVQRLFDVLLNVALGPLSEGRSLVVFIDEIDTTRGLPFNVDEFFAAVRECFNRRVSEPAFTRLTFCLLGVAVPSDLIKNRATTPFNIGERIILDDFTLKELSPFAPQLGPNGQEILTRVHYWTGGHPYLSQSICRALAALEEPKNSKTVDEVVRRELFDFKARESNINLADVSNIALHYGDKESEGDDLRADLLSVYKHILAGQPVMDDESSRAVVLLKLSGIVRSNGRRLYIRNRIYEHVFDRHWIDEHMPGQELRRERQSFRRGVLRTAFVTGSMLVIVASIAAVAWFSRLQEIRAEERLDYELYVADITSMRQFFETGETRRIEAVLNRHKASPYRGFEWGYWLGRYHDSQEEYTLAYKASGKREEGHISADGKQIGIVDNLSLTATVVDRASKNKLFCTPIQDFRQVLPTQSHWVEVRRMNDYNYTVLDLATGKALSRLGRPGHRLHWILPIEHSDYIATGESPGVSGGPFEINLWNSVTGKAVFGMPNPWSLSDSDPWKSRDFLNFSPDGRYFAYAQGTGKPVPGGPPGNVAGEAIVLDLWTRKVVDRFPVDSLTETTARGIQSPFLLYLAQGRPFVRDTKKHVSRAISLDISGDWRVIDGAILGTDLVLQLDGGRLVVHDLLGRRPDTIRGNVFSVFVGSGKGQYVASASSARLYDVRSPSLGEVVAVGNRVTRFLSGTLNLFQGEGKGILRVRESDFHPVGSVPSIGDGAAYTYGGRWYKSRGPKGDQLNDGSVPAPPIQLPFSPTIWSCGIQADSIALYTGAERLVRYSGLRKKIVWRRKDVENVNSLWVSPDGTRLFAGQDERMITVFDMANGKTIGTLDSHNMGPINLTFSRDSRRVFTCGGDGRAVMWDVASLKKLMEFRGNDQEGLSGADLSPDGRRVVTSSRSGSWQLWDASNGVQLMDVRVSATPLSAAIFCLDGRRIVTSGDDNQIRVWRTVDADPTTYVPIDPAYLRSLHL